MSEIRIHSGDPTRPPRAARLEGSWAWVFACALLASGATVVVGLAGAPDLISFLVRSADRFALRESARRGQEALDSVKHRADVLGRRLAADELFLARLAVLSNVPLPAGLPGDPSPSGAPDELVAALQARVFSCEALRRRIASSTKPLPPGFDPDRVPSRSPVEPTVSVPISVFGNRVSPLTHAPEFHAGLTLAVPAGAVVVAPAAATVVFAGPSPTRAGASWRALGTVVVLAHDASTRTVYGHLAKATVKKGQTVRRGDAIANVGQTGFAPAPQLHYEVLKAESGRFVPVDPRLYILDADWITAAEVRSRPIPPPEAELPGIEQAVPSGTRVHGSRSR